MIVSLAHLCGKQNDKKVIKRFQLAKNDLFHENMARNDHWIYESYDMSHRNSKKSDYQPRLLIIYSFFHRMQDNTVLHRWSYCKSTVFIQVGTCGGSTDLRSGSLRSPGYGKKYPTDIKCLWQVKPEVSDNDWIQIEFKKSDFGKCADKGFRYNAKPKR